MFRWNLNKTSKKYTHICMLGDYSLPNINWSTLSTGLSTADWNFVQVINTHSEQINFIPSNMHGSLLDLIFTNTSNIHSDMIDLEEDFATDHAVLGFAISTKSPQAKEFKTYIYNFKKANLGALNVRMHYSTLEKAFENCKL